MATTIETVRLKDKLHRAAVMTEYDQAVDAERCAAIAQRIDEMYADGAAWQRTKLVADHPELALDIAVCLLRRARSENDVAFVAADLLEEIVSIANSPLMTRVLAKMNDPVFCRCLSYCYMANWPSTAIEEIDTNCDRLLT